MALLTILCSLRERHAGRIHDGTLESQIIDYLYGNLLEGEGEGTYPPPSVV